MTYASNLQKLFANKDFVITSEVSSPDASTHSTLIERLDHLKHSCDAINATDASGAHCHMSSMAASKIMIDQGIEPILQISCRDRNRIAIQGDVIGAHALGIRNILCLTGDGVETGDHPEAKAVFDLDSITLLQTISHIKNTGTFLSGRKLENQPDLFLGAASNPFAPPFDFRPFRLQKKIEAGCQFIQTQYCFDIPRLKSFMETARDLGLDKQCHILVGVGPLKSAATAEWITKNVPGVVIPDETIGLLRRTPKESQIQEGKKICIDIINQVRSIKGIAGVHIMAYLLDHLVPEIVSDSVLSKEVKSRKSEN